MSKEDERARAAIREADYVIMTRVSMGETAWVIEAEAKDGGAGIKIRVDCTVLDGQEVLDKLAEDASDEEA